MTVSNFFQPIVHSFVVIQYFLNIVSALQGATIPDIFSHDPLQK